MITYTKKYIKTIRLNSFHPLCETGIGMNAINKYGFPPFIDASCRREPDFENPFPSITALCRQEAFAPQLFPNDIVVYVTVKGKWFTDFNHYRLIAILEVIDRKETHMLARSWYYHKGIKVPSNCMVEGNPPYSFVETAGNYEKQTDIGNFLNYLPDKQKVIAERRIKIWNDEYLRKSKKWGAFIITRPVYLNLDDPPILTEEDIFSIFSKRINTRTPKKLSKSEFKEIAKFANINFIQP